MAYIRFVKEYDSYLDYLTHQSEKSNLPEVKDSLLNNNWASRVKWFYSSFKNLFTELKYPLTKQKKALCLGARFGHEIRALSKLNINAIGIDLNAYPEMKVQKGDVHNLDFKDNSFHVVFTNIVDHVLSPEKFASEAMRVLKPEGYLIMHLAVAKSTDSYGVIEIDTSDPIKDLFIGKGDCIINRAFEKKWGGLNWLLVIQKK